jgi:hypothetical protein
MPRSLRFAVSAASLALLLSSVAMSFWSGCTADLKTGSHGNPAQALQIQGWSLILAIGASIGLAWAAAIWAQGRGAAATVKWGIFTFLAALVVCYAAGWQAETEGVRQCFYSQQ